MKWITLKILAVLFSVVLNGYLCEPAKSFEAPGNKKDWVLVPEFSDEFIEDKLDSDKWHNRNPKWKGRPPVYFHPDCIQLGDGKLHLSAFASTESGKKKLPQGFSHISGFVSSKNLIRFGYFEIRAKLMDSSLVSCFWLSRHTKEEWSEIDCVEMAAGVKKHNGVFRPNLHYFFGPQYKGTHEKHWVSPAQIQLDFDPTQEFHTYGVEWSATHIRWYVDNKMVRETENKYHFQPLNLHMNVESNDWFEARPDDKRLPAEYEIDWVRSYQRKSDLISYSQ